MSGIIALLFLGAAYLLIKLFTLLFPEQARRKVWAVVVGCIVAYPFLYHLYPSYWQFKSLCERPERFVIRQVIPVRSVFYDSGEFQAYRFAQKRHFESVDIKQGKLGYFRLKVNDEWHKPACQTACATHGLFQWEKTCLANCITKTSIETPEFEHKFDNQQLELSEGTLSENRVVVHAPNGDQLAISSAYTYYPYGAGWARMLGGGSGTPPSKKCEHDTRLWTMEFLKPMTTR